MSKEFNKANLSNLIERNMNLFCAFDKIYVFGSILEKDKDSADIDILLLYSTFSSDVLRNISKIMYYLEQETSYQIDITALSFEEEKEVGFINKLDHKYVCIK